MIAESIQNEAKQKKESVSGGSGWNKKMLSAEEAIKKQGASEGWSQKQILKKISEAEASIHQTAEAERINDDVKTEGVGWEELIAGEKAASQAMRELVAAEAQEATVELLKEAQEGHGWRAKHFESKVRETKEALKEEELQREAEIQMASELIEKAAIQDLQTAAKTEAEASVLQNLDADDLALHPSWTQKMIQTKLKAAEKNLTAEAERQGWSRKVLALKIAAAEARIQTDALSQEAMVDDDHSTPWTKTLVRIQQDAQDTAEASQEAMPVLSSFRDHRINIQEARERIVNAQSGHQAETWSEKLITAKMKTAELQLLEEANARGWSQKLLAAKIAVVEEAIESQHALASKDCKDDSDDSEALASSFQEDPKMESSFQEDPKTKWSKKILTKRLESAEEALRAEAVEFDWSQQLLQAKLEAAAEEIQGSSLAPTTTTIQQQSTDASLGSNQKKVLATRLELAHHNLREEAKASNWSPKLLQAKLSATELEIIEQTTSEEGESPQSPLVGWSEELLVAKVDAAKEEVRDKASQSGWGPKALKAKLAQAAETVVEAAIQAEAQIPAESTDFNSPQALKRPSSRWSKERVTAKLATIEAKIEAVHEELEIEARGKGWSRRLLDAKLEAAEERIADEAVDDRGPPPNEDNFRAGGLKNKIASREKALKEEVALFLTLY